MSERSQFCHVRNKAQLIVAFGCARGFPGVTQIVLFRKDGSTTHYTLGPNLWYQQIGYTDLIDWKQMRDYDKELRKAIALIRKVPAIAFQ